MEAETRLKKEKLMIEDEAISFLVIEERIISLLEEMIFNLLFLFKEEDLLEPYKLCHNPSREGTCRGIILLEEPLLLGLRIV